MKWKPEKGDPYCMIMTAGNIGYFVWEDSEIDNYLWSVGKIYKTEKLALFDSDKAKVKAELERYAREHNDPDHEEWNRCYIHFCIQLPPPDNSHLRIAEYCNFKTESVTYFTSRKIAENAIKVIGEDRIKKYLFGVEVEDE